MSDRTDTDASVKFRIRPVDGNNAADPDDLPTLDAILVDVVNGRSLYAVVDFGGTDASPERPVPPWVKK